MSDRAPGGALPPSGSRGRDAELVALFRAHYVQLVRLARLVVDDPESAEDVVQDAFVSLHRRWGSLRDSNAALAYLRSAVLNGSRSVLRRRVVRRRRDRGELVLVPSAEAVAVEQDDARAVARALSTLPLRQRQVLVLRYFLDMSEAEIAATLGISRGSVKTHASRAVSSMGTRLEPVQ